MTLYINWFNFFVISHLFKCHFKFLTTVKLNVPSLQLHMYNYTGQQISKKKIVSVMNMLLIFFFASIEL